jgi:hypothetical protein
MAKNGGVAYIFCGWLSVIFVAKSSRRNDL